MKLTGLRKEKETEEIIEYELSLYRHEISCLYKDRYGVYVATHSGKLYKVKNTLEEIQLEIN